MIETIAKVAEILKNQAEYPKSAVDISKTYDADKRIETGKRSDSARVKGHFDPDARVESYREQHRLNEEDKKHIKEETGWSDKIIGACKTKEQYEIYKNASLRERVVDGRSCLVKDINMNYVDPKTGMTNGERMAKGRAPIDHRTGEKIELHHMGQKSNAPFAELCENSEHGDGNHSTLHPKTTDSWRKDADLNAKYQKEKSNHWKARAQEI